MDGGETIIVGGLCALDALFEIDDLDECSLDPFIGNGTLPIKGLLAFEGPCSPIPPLSFFDDERESVLKVVENGDAGVEPRLAGMRFPPSREAGGEVVSDGDEDLRWECEVEDEREALEDCRLAITGFLSFEWKRTSVPLKRPMTPSQ